MKRLQLALVVGFILGLTSPGHPALKTVTGCVKAMRLIAPGVAFPSYAIVGNKDLIFGQNKMHITPMKVSEPYALTLEDWAKWERIWGLLKAGAEAKATTLIFYDDTTNVVSTIHVVFDKPCTSAPPR